MARKRLITNPRTVLLPPVIHKPEALAPALVPSSSTIGVPAKSGSVVPSMNTCAVISGKADSGRIVWGTEPEISNAIVSLAARALASSIAARKVQLPRPSSQTPSPGSASLLSPFVFTVKVRLVLTAIVGENSEVLPFASVAVATITVPSVTPNCAALPKLSDFRPLLKSSSLNCSSSRSVLPCPFGSASNI